MEEDEIKEKIEDILGKNYFRWKIGITDNPEIIKTKLSSGILWHFWETKSEQNSMALESWFIEKGTHQCPLSNSLESNKTDKKDIFVYIY